MPRQSSKLCWTNSTVKQGRSSADQYHHSVGTTAKEPPGVVIASNGVGALVATIELWDGLI